MGLLSNITSFISNGTFQAESLPPVPLPKAPKGATAVPSHRTTVSAGTSAVRQTDRQLLTTDRLTARNSAGTNAALRTLSYSSPDMSSAIYAVLRTGIPEKYTLVARDMDGNIDPDATQMAQSLVRRLTFLGNVDGSYGNQLSLQSLSESLARELLIYGACSGEIALDKARIPASLNPISVSKLKWYDEDNSVRPVQVVGGTEIDLDLPSFIYVSVDQDLLDPYASSPLESAQQPILTDLDFNNDIRRALKRAVLPRLLATIDSEMVKKFCPPEVLNDPDALAKYKNDLIQAVQSVVNQAAPEDALVSFAEVSYDILDGGQDPSAIIEKMQKVLNSKLQTGVKTMPVVLGHGGSANASSSETLLFIKNANMVRVKLNEFYSKAFTMALRMMAKDVYVEFVYAHIDLRPDAELAAYKTMEQSRILDLLSLGFITDEEASVMLTGNLPPQGFKPLSGTMFRAKTEAPQGAGQPGTAASGTSGLKATPEAPKGPVSKPKAEVDSLQEAHATSLAAIQDMAYAMQRNANRPVEVTVNPSEMHLTLAEGSSKTRSIKVIKGEDGKMIGMELSDAN